MTNIILKEVKGSPLTELKADYADGKENLDKAYKQAVLTGNYYDVFDQVIAMTNLQERIQNAETTQDQAAKIKYENNKTLQSKYANYQDYMMSSEFQNVYNAPTTVFSINPESSVGKAMDTVGDVFKSAVSGYVPQGMSMGLGFARLAEDVQAAGINKVMGFFNEDFQPRQSYAAQTLLPGLALAQAMGMAPSTSTLQSDAVNANTGKLLPSTEQIQTAAKNVDFLRPAFEFQPQTRAGEYAQTIGSFATPLSILGVPGKAQMGAAVLGGGVYEATQSATDNPLLATGASLAAIIGGNYAVSTQRASNLANKALKNVSKEEIIVAMELEKIANKLNIPITANELLDSKLLDDIFDATARSDKQAGLNIEKYLKNRPEALRDTVDDLMNQILIDPQIAKKLGFENIQQMLKETKTRIANKRTLESQAAGYNIGDDIEISKDFIDDIIKKIDIEISAGSQNTQKINALNGLKKSLTKQDGSTLTLTKDLSEVYRIYSDVIAKAGPEALDKTIKNILTNNNKTGLVDDLEKALQTNPQWLKGNKKFAEMSQAVDEAFAYLKFADKNVDMNAIKKMLFDTENLNVKDIRNFYNILDQNVKNNKNLKEIVGGKDLGYVNFEDPFSTFVNLYMRNIFNKTFTNVAKDSKGKIKADAAFNFNKELFPNETARANFNEILRLVAKEQGVDPKKLLEGWTNFSKIAEKTGKKIQGPSTQTSPTIASHLLRLGSFMYRVSLGRMLDRQVDSSALETFSSIFTSKNSVEGLVTLADQPNNIRAINAVIGLTAYQQGAVPEYNRFMDAQDYVESLEKFKEDRKLNKEN